MSISRSGFCVLGCLSSGPKSGYDIRMMMREVTSFFWRESDGQLYPALKKLTEDGCINQLDASGGRNKKVYEITALGKNVLQEWLVQPAADAQVRSEFLLKVFLGNELSREQLVAHLERELQRVKERVLRLRELRRSLEDHGGNPRVVECWSFTMEAGMELAESEVRWCERTIATLHAKIDERGLGGEMSGSFS